MECAAAAKAVAQKSADQLECKFFAWCACYIDISKETPERRKDLRRGKCGLCCTLCQQQGKRSTDQADKTQEDFRRCVASAPSAMCVRLGRFQAKGRFPLKRSVSRPKVSTSDPKDERARPMQEMLCSSGHHLRKPTEPKLADAGVET